MNSSTILILFISSFIIPLNSYAQTKSNYFDKNWYKTSLDSATYLREVTPESDCFKVTDYYLPSKTILSNGIYADKKLKIKRNTFEYFHSNGHLLKRETYNSKGQLEGNIKSYYENDVLDYDVNYNNGQLNGECKWYHLNGKLASKEVYKNGILDQIEFWDETGKIVPAKIGDEPILPYFGYGKYAAQNFMYSKIIFPEAARYLSDGGRVLLNFTIESDGLVSAVKVELSEDPILDREAVRVGKLLPRWKAGRQHNRQARFENIMIPIFFNLVLSPNEELKYQEK